LGEDIKNYHFWFYGSAPDEIVSFNEQYSDYEYVYNGENKVRDGDKLIKNVTYVISNL